MPRHPGPTQQVPVVPAADRVFVASDGWRAGGVFLVTLLAYCPALTGGLLWDDAGHVTAKALRSLDGLFRIWFEIGATQQYYPLLHSAFWLEHWLWGDSTLGYHLLNVLLHATAACLFGRLLCRLAVPGAWLAALLFALHPVGVESVAWISEQKNTLSAVFYLAAALAYLRFDAQRRPSHYALATGFFVLALLTKTVTATLPAALLVVAWWQRGRLEWRRDLAPLLPWFVLGAASGLLTAHFERELIGAQGANFDLSLLQRCLLAGRIAWFYPAKLLWPAGLSFVYPRWTVDPMLAGPWLFPLAALVLLAALAWWSRRQRGPLAATLLYGGTLFPVLGFFNVYPFIFSYVADHFQYLASLALFALAAAGLTRLLQRLPRWGGVAARGALLAVLGALSWTQAGKYQNVFSLYEDTLAHNPDCWMAHNNLAMALADSGRIDEAIPHLEHAIALRPAYPEAENNLGNDLLRLDRQAEAIPHLERALELQPNYAVAHRNLGLALATSNRTAEAIAHFEQAVRLDPTYADAELNWGIGLMLLDRFPEAVPHFERSIQLEPQSADYHLTYGRALLRAGRYDEAISQFKTTVLLQPDNADAHMNLALALRQTGRQSEAAGHYQEAIRLNPDLQNQRP